VMHVIDEFDFGMGLNGDSIEAAEFADLRK
jgi:hypothetical protein